MPTVLVLRIVALERCDFPADRIVHRYVEVIMDSTDRAEGVGKQIVVVNVVERVSIAERLTGPPWPAANRSLPMRPIPRRKRTGSNSGSRPRRIVPTKLATDASAWPGSRWVHTMRASGYFHKSAGSENRCFGHFSTHSPGTPNCRCCSSVEVVLVGGTVVGVQEPFEIGRHPAGGRCRGIDEAPVDEADALLGPGRAKRMRFHQFAGVWTCIELLLNLCDSRIALEGDGHRRW